MYYGFLIVSQLYLFVSFVFISDWFLSPCDCLNSSLNLSFDLLTQIAIISQNCRKFLLCIDQLSSPCFGNCFSCLYLYHQLNCIVIILLTASNFPLHNAQALLTIADNSIKVKNFHMAQRTIWPCWEHFSIQVYGLGVCFNGWDVVFVFKKLISFIFQP